MDYKVTVSANMSLNSSTLEIKEQDNMFKKDDIFWNPEVDEYLIVTADQTTNTIPVKHYSGTASQWDKGVKVFTLPKSLRVG